MGERLTVKIALKRTILVLAVFLLYLPVFADITLQYAGSPISLVFPAAATILTVFVAIRVAKIQPVAAFARAPRKPSGWMEALCEGTLTQITSVIQKTGGATTLHSNVRIQNAARFSSSVRS